MHQSAVAGPPGAGLRLLCRSACMLKECRMGRRRPDDRPSPAAADRRRAAREHPPCLQKPWVAASKRPAGEEHSSEDEEQGGKPRKALEDMSIDEFLDGGFLDVAAQPPAAAQPSDDEEDDTGGRCGRTLIHTAAQIPCIVWAPSSAAASCPLLGCKLQAGLFPSGPPADDLSGSDLDELEGSSDEEGAPVPAAIAGKKVAKQQQEQQAGRKRKQQEAPSSDEEGEEPVVSEDEPYDSEAEEEDGSGEDDSEEGEEGAGVTSSSDEDDEDEGQPRSKAALRKEMQAHKAQLEKLREQDPEFYAYLQVGLPACRRLGPACPWWRPPFSSRQTPQGSGQMGSASTARAGQGVGQVLKVHVGHNYPRLKLRQAPPLPPACTPAVHRPGAAQLWQGLG